MNACLDALIQKCATLSKGSEGDVQFLYGPGLLLCDSLV